MTASVIINDMDDEIKRIVEKAKVERDIFSKARLINYLYREKNLALNNLSQIFGFKKSYICQLIRLLKLPEILIDGYYTKTVSLSHLIIISRLKTSEDMIKAYEEVLAKNLSANQVEDLVREKIYQIKNKGTRVNSVVIDKIKNKFKKIDKDLEVKITQTRIRAKITLLLKGDLEKTSHFLEKISED